MKDYIYLATVVRIAGACFNIKANEHAAKYLHNIDSAEFDTLFEEAQSLALGSEGHTIDLKALRPLIPIASNIHKRVEEWNLGTNVFPINSLSLEKKKSFPLFQDAERGKDVLIKQFEEEWGAMPLLPVKAMAENLLNLLFKYGSQIALPSPFDDVSLYDHCRVVAALTMCLFESKNSEEVVDKPFLLIGADFSGIQSYLYQIVSKYAAKNLKGRSFYLRLLSDAIVRYVLKKLDLPQSNVLYNSGGGFYVIAPNTTEVKETLAIINAEIEESLFAAHGTSLYVAIDSVVMSKAALLQQDGQSLSDVWGNLFNRRDAKKQHKFSQLIERDYSKFFSPDGHGSDNKIDAITGEEIPPKEKAVSIPGIGNVRQTTAEQIELGKSLRDVEVMLVTDSEVKALSAEMMVEPASLGFYYYLTKKKQLRKAAAEINENAHAIAFNGENLTCGYIQEGALNCIHELSFYGGNSFENQTFSDMCDKGSDAAFERLGVLRMDVDNLGSLFQQGICREKSILARYSSLSRSLDYFFSGYINTIQQQIAPLTSFIIYSGGDDLFVVGSWEDTIKIAEQIQTDFKDFTCHNPAFSISGGIAIIEPKYPIIRGAEDSAEEESNAKSHLCGTDSKNSISFMNMALNWDKEYPSVKDLKDQICILIEREVLSKSFISKILQHYLNAEVTHHQIPLKHVRLYWLLTYDLHRMKERLTSIEAKKLVDNCKKEICENNKTLLNGKPIQTDYHPLELWAMAARWAELDMRTNNN